MSQYTDLWTLVIMPAGGGGGNRPVLAASGTRFAYGLYGLEDPLWGKEFVNVYGYQNQNNNNTGVGGGGDWQVQDTIIGPEQESVTQFGADDSLTLSYDGSVVAIGATDYRHDGRTGLVQVFERSGEERGYLQKGQTLFWELGDKIALSKNGDILASVSSYYRNRQHQVQVYQFYDGSWKHHGKAIVSPNNQGADFLTLSADGTRVAIGWGVSHVTVYEIPP